MIRHSDFITRKKMTKTVPGEGVGVGNLMEILLSPKEFSLTFQLTIHS
jgi:hypothetical protein